MAPTLMGRPKDGKVLSLCFRFRVSIMICMQYSEILNEASSMS